MDYGFSDEVRDLFLVFLDQGLERAFESRLNPRPLAPLDPPSQPLAHNPPPVGGVPARRDHALVAAESTVTIRDAVDSVKVLVIVGLYLRGRGAPGLLTAIQRRKYPLAEIHTTLHEAQA